MVHDLELSAAARRFRDQALPRLLATVRLRARRRLRRRVGLAALCGTAALALLALWGAGSGPSSGVVPEPSVPFPPRTVCRVVDDDPSILARCAIATRSRPEWFVDDDGLQALLADAGRPSGLVRFPDHVVVRLEAIDDYRLQP